MDPVERGYKGLVREIIKDGFVSRREHHKLTDFRARHRVSDEQHKDWASDVVHGWKWYHYLLCLTFVIYIIPPITFLLLLGVFVGLFWRGLTGPIASFFIKLLRFLWRRTCGSWSGCSSRSESAGGGGGARSQLGNGQELVAFVEGQVEYVASGFSEDAGAVEQVLNGLNIEGQDVGVGGYLDQAACGGGC